MPVLPRVEVIGDAADAGQYQRGSVDVIYVAVSPALGGVGAADVYEPIAAMSQHGYESIAAMSQHDVVEPAISAATTEFDTDSDAEPDAGATEVVTRGHRFERMHRNWWEGNHGVVDARPFGPGPCARPVRRFNIAPQPLGD